MTGVMQSWSCVIAWTHFGEEPTWQSGKGCFHIIPNIVHIFAVIHNSHMVLHKAQVLESHTGMLRLEVPITTSACAASVAAQAHE